MAVRTTISLPEDTAELLKLEAKRLGKPAAEIVREALDEHLGICRTEKRKLPFEYLVKGNGETLSDKIDALLAETWADDIARDR